jgi:hypothetical protein
MKRERVEDLGVINEKLRHIIDDFEERFPYFDSKHQWETFRDKMVKDDYDGLDDLHRALRYLKEQLWEVWCIARGDDQEAPY